MRIQSDIPVAARASFLAVVQASLDRSFLAPLRAVARSVRRVFATVAVATVVLATSVIATSAITSLASAAPAAIPPQPRAGTQLPDLTASQQVRFALGRVAYETPLEVADGLGPAFNQTSCAACHETPIGGWGATRVTRFGNLSGGNFDFLEALGGPVLQRFAISTACEEELPPAAIANHVRDRVTPSVLAFGLVEAISDDAILALADPNDANGDGISGRAHLVVPLEDPASPLRVGRFGWKAQIATIRSFSGDAARNEMGLTNAVIASETAPNGDAALLADCDDIPDIEDAPDAFGASFVDRVTDFQRYLAPPPQSPRSGMAGESIFNAIGCVKCHARQFITSSSEALEPVLRAQTIRPYSDFLLHDMGSLADGIPDGNALPTEMRTPPLWNLRTRPVLLHDGSANAPLFATRVESAILAHAGEGLASRNAYAALSAADKAKVIAFLDSLGRDDYDVDGDGLLTNLDLGIVVAHAADTNVTPDEAWAVADLDQDGQIESDEVNGLRSLLGVPADCNQNGLADWSEIATGATNDQNGNGVPDECDQSNCTARVKRVTGTGGAIPDAGGGSLSRSISVTAPAGNPSIQSIRVSLDINHTWASDLTITLRRGTDAPITLHSGCGTFHDLNGRYQLVDTAWEGAPGTLITICQGAFIDNGNANGELRFTFAPGTYRPAQGTASTGFQTMRGQSMAANWTLTITDSRSNDVGTLVSWSLDFRYADPSPTDCDGTGGPDCAQIVADPSLDCDHDGIIDSCQPLGGDCDANGVRDRCQVAEGTATDCNANGTLDICEIAAGSTRDCNANGVPDTCEIADGDEADVDLDTILDRCERAFGDLDLDGTVGAADLALLLSVWGTPNPPFADFDGDAIVAAADLSFLLSKWGASPPWMVPTISSVSPNIGPAAGGTAITITGTNLTGASSVTIGGAAATSVSVVNATTVTAVTPAGAAGAQSVSVTTPSGTASLAGAFTYQAASPPTISSVTPNAGALAGGTAITITGTNLTGTSSVTIGGTAATSVSVVNATTVTAVTPAGTAGAKTVSLTTPGGTANLTNGFTYVAAPTIASITPNSGATTGGTALTISGAGFTGATGVSIGGVAATSVVVVNATTITANAPALSAGVYTVAVTTPYGSGSLANAYTAVVYPPPTVSSITPNVGPIAGGTAVTISGSDFTGATSVTIGGVAATNLVVVSTSTITATTPAGTAGAKNVVVTSPWGQGTLNNGFTYFAQPTLSSVSPNAGPTAGGTPITITGTNLTGTTSVTVGGAAATSVSVVNSTTVTAVTPAGTSGAKTVSLTTPGGTANLSNGFTYGLSPSISSVTPNVGPTAGGTAITITGTNLTGTSSVTVGGSAATSVVVVNSTTVTAVTPAGSAGAANVSLTTPYGTATANGAFTYQTYSTPTISSVAPNSGSTAGGTAITITGTNLTGTSSVTIGGAAATSVSVVNSTTVTAVTPAGTAGAKTVSLTTPGGTANLTNGFTYTTVWYTVLEQNPDPAIVTSATLRNAITATGYPWRVRDNGTNIEMVLIPPGTFNMGCSASIQFGCSAAESPVHSVTITSAFYMGRYEVTQARWIARMGSNPSYFVARPENGNTANTNRPVERVSWNQIAGAGGFLSGTGLRLPTEAEWEYAYRAGTTTAFHGFTGYLSGTNDDTLVGNIAWFSGNNGASGTPTYGTKAVGQKLANGFGLHDMSGNVWEWVNDWYSSSYYASSPSSNPTGPATGSSRVLRGGSWNFNAYYVRSSNRDYFSPDYSSNFVGFRVARTPAGTEAPAIMSVSPASGSTDGGTAITITGTNLTGTSSVTIGGTAATSVSVLNSTTVTAVTPAGTAGAKTVSLTTPGGTTSLVDRFVYFSTPTWATVLEQNPDPAVVTSATLRNAITATGYPWRVRDNGTQIEMVLVPPGTFNMGCSESDAYGCAADENPVNLITLSNPFYMGRYEVTQAQWQARMGTNPAYFREGNGYPNSTARPVESVSWNMIAGTDGFLSGTGLRLPTEAEWEYAYRAGTTTAYHGSLSYIQGMNADSQVGVLAWFLGNNGGWGTGSYGTKEVGQKLANGFGIFDTSGNVQEWVSDWYSSSAYSSTSSMNPSGPASGIARVIRGGAWLSSASELRSSRRSSESQTVSDRNDIGFRVARTPAGVPVVDSITPSVGPDSGGTLITITGSALAGTTSVTVGGSAATDVTVVNDSMVTAVTPAGTAGAQHVALVTSTGTATLSNGFTYFAAPTISSVSPSAGPTCCSTEISITGANLIGTTSVTIGGIAATGVTVVDGVTVKALAPVGLVGPQTVSISTPGGIASLDDGFTYVATPTVSSLSPASGPTVGGTVVTITGLNLSGTSAVTIGGVAASSVTVVNPTTVTAVTPAGAVGAQVLTLTTASGTVDVANGFTYADVTVPSWGTLLEPLPNPAVVPNASLRAAIIATGYPWRVRDNGTQIEMVLIPPGSFDMGCSAPNGIGCRLDENPVHAVTLTNAFYMGRYEVTQAQWQARMGSNPSYYVATPSNGNTANTNRPVEQVSWNQIVGPGGFLTGTGLRLPTEAEWEYACRAGTTTAFHGFAGHLDGTNDDMLVGDIAWFYGNRGTFGTPTYGTKAVGQKFGNGFGLHDMLGNVEEWVNDGYAYELYDASPITNPTQVSSGLSFSVRGGRWLSGTSNLRASSRQGRAPDFVASSTGFRVARFVAGGGIPVSLSITPSVGPDSGGTLFTITGSALAGTTSVTVGGNAATDVTVVNDSMVTAVTPAGTAGAQHVALVTPTVTATLSNGFTYFAAPTISSVSPSAGPTCCSTEISITGTNLIDTTSVTIGGLAATGVTVVDGVTVKALAPVGLVGPQNVSISTPGGIASLADGFTYVATPTVSSLSPASGPTVGGTVVTITGLNLSGTSAVTIGGVAASSVTVVNPTTVTAVTPAGAVGAQVLTLTTASGTVDVANGFTYADVTVPSWGTLLEPLPNPAVVPNASLRAAIIATGYPWRVRDNGTQIEMVLIPPGSFDMGCSASSPAGCPTNESPVHSVTLTNAFYMGRYEVTQAQWEARMGTNPSYFTEDNGFPDFEERPVEQVSWNQIMGPGGFFTGTGLRLPTEAEWEYACRAGTTTAFHGFAGYLDGTNDDSLVGNVAWFGGEESQPVGAKAPNGFGLHDMLGNVWELVTDWYSSTYYASSPVADPRGPASGTSRTMRGGAFEFWFWTSSGRYSRHPNAVNYDIGFRVARTPAGVPVVDSITPSVGPDSGGTLFTITGSALAGTTSVTVGGNVATDVTVVNDSMVTAVTPAGTAGAQHVVLVTPTGTATFSNGFTYFAAPTISSVSPSAGPTCCSTEISITGTNLIDTTAVTIGGIAATGVTVVDGVTVKALAPVGLVGPQTVSISTPGGIASLDDGFTYVASPTVSSLSPASGPTVGGTVVTITGLNLSGTSAVTIGGVAASSVTVVNPTTVTAVTPAGAVGAQVLTLTTASGTVDVANGFTYADVTVPSWGTLLEPLPNPAVVPNASLRAAIIATGYPWRVRDNGTQIEMVLIPPGSFDMGCSASNQSGCDLDENPVHAVTLTNAFYMGRYEVTQAQWQARMGSNPSYFQPPNSATADTSRPVERVSWNMIAGTGGFLSGTGLRLPTEAEWEYACRAGTTTAFHGFTGYLSGTNNDTFVGNIAWYTSNSSSQTRPVGGKLANGFGLHDMSGNVWEWVNDWYSSSYYASSPSSNPTGPATGTYRVLRGGSWISYSFFTTRDVRSSNRGYDAPGGTGYYVGFRVARTAAGLDSPAISAVIPPSGTIAGGARITISGFALSGTTNVTIGGVAASEVTVVDSTTVTAVTPPGVAGSATISLTAAGGRTVAPEAFVYWNPGYTVVDSEPDAAIVTDPAMRAAIMATGYAWRVRDNATGIEMVLIPPGTFSMGCSASSQFSCGSDESPNHNIAITEPFYMGRFEVTQAQWRARMGTNPSCFQSASDSVPLSQVLNRPVEMLSWSMIAGTDGFLSETGLRLPTEAEWEFAYRAGTDTAFHAFSGYSSGTNDDSRVGEIAWHGANSEWQTRPVGTRAANGFGLHDMSGNVKEWTNDWYLANYYALSSSENPTGPESGSHRVLRGGSWNGDSGEVRSSIRSVPSDENGPYDRGFRVARSPRLVGVPTISGVLPAVGLVSGGTQITITGTNLTGTSSVTIGGTAATSVSVVNATTVTAVTPAGTAGAKTVSLTTPGGTANLSNGFTYTTVWYTVLEQNPDPAVVTSATLRNAIIATGYPWRVRDNGTQIEMVLIPPGTFNMGCSASNQYACYSDESPVHSVTLTSAFYMGRYEVTQSQWQARMGSNPSSFTSASAQVPAAQVPNRPVERVSWNMIAGTGGFLSGTGLRLPTEAEWEYACRAGTTTAFHGFTGYLSGTNDDTLVGNIAWYTSNSSSQTRPVGGKLANGFGLHDMSGNVWEWVNDWYSSSYYASSPSSNPTGPATGTNRVLRGGAWSHSSLSVRSSERISDTPVISFFNIGFRVARAPL